MCFPAALRHLKFAVALLALSTLGTLSSAKTQPDSSDLANVEILIVRHAERDGFLDKLTAAGLKRASAYAHYFDPLRLGDRSIVPTHLFAEKSDRTQRTLEPLAQAMNLPLDTRFSNKQVKELADDLRTHRYGSEIVICWHHGTIPSLIRALGGDPDQLIPGGKWPQGTYDWLVDLRFDSAGKLGTANETLVHEHLMPGDSK